MNSPTDRSINIQILRGVAALFVIVDHSVQWAITGRGYDQKFIILAGSLGTLGVLVFFVISGYIMTETNRTNFGDWRHSAVFLGKRVSRIAPIYFIGTIIAAFLLFSLKGILVSWQEFFYSIFFIAKFTNIEHLGFFPILGVGWTLNLEIFFYIVFASSMVFSRKTSLTITIMTLSCVVLLGFILGHYHFFPKSSSAIFYSRPIILLFVAGILLSIVVKRIPNTPYFKYFPGAIGLSILTGLILSFSVLFGIYDRFYIQGLLPLFSILIVFAAIWAPIHFNLRIKEIFKRIGDASYSLYVFHTLVIMIIMKLYSYYNFTVLFVELLILLFVSIFLSLIFYEILEIPLRRLVEKPFRVFIENRIRKSSR